MTKKHLLAGVSILAVLLAAGWGCKKIFPAQAEQALEEIRPTVGPLKNAISTTGVVEPQNRLEIKPPIGGRVEKILVQEGDRVKIGQVLALMSSTERATLLDAAHLQGQTEQAYWEKVYKATPLLAPIQGKVIVRAVEPGQTVTANDAIFVLSDRLIVKANVDETDIGVVAKGQEAVIGLDAYPDVEIGGQVDHISYESTVVNNVTIYNVDIVPQSVPDIFRSGMSANIEIIQQSRDQVLQLPLTAIREKEGRTVVLVKDQSPRGFSPRPVQLGLRDLTQVEILSGLSVEDVVVIKNQAVSGRKSPATKNDSPFAPKFRGRRRR